MSAAIQQAAEEPSANFGEANGAAQAGASAKDDEVWASRNLRFAEGRAILDLANALRVVERHADYQGRFRYNEMINRVLDRGVVMVDWRLYEFTAEIQERFLPGVCGDLVDKALTIAANRASAKR